MFSVILISICNLLSAQESVDGQSLPETNPVFQVNFVHPTADKPQSKLWFMDGCWWTILPDSTGPTLWQRTDKGWKNHLEIAEKLRGVPGRADVWAGEKQVTAVGVADSSLTVFRLLKKDGSSGAIWKAEILTKLYPPVPSAIETATIAKDGDDNWWVVATTCLKVCVWFSSDDGKNWTGPSILAEGIDEDDICVITPLNDGVGLIWSDQIRDAVLIREHRDGKPASDWGKEMVIESGNKTADDHLNTVLTPDGTLWLTSKNSVDEAGKPQFVLRVRSVQGKWKNIPYLILENRMKRPSRPIVVATDDNSYVFVGHGDNDRSVPYPYNSEIEFAVAPASSVSSELLNNPQPVIVPDSTYKFVVHNVTGPKKPFPKDAPWIILASDAKGWVYEADLKKLIQICTKK